MLKQTMKGSRYKKCEVCQKSVRFFEDLVTITKETNIWRGEFLHKGVCEKMFALKNKSVV